MVPDSRFRSNERKFNFVRALIEKGIEPSILFSSRSIVARFVIKAIDEGMVPVMKFPAITNVSRFDKKDNSAGIGPWKNIRFLDDGEINNNWWVRSDQHTLRLFHLRSSATI
mmetsp:Transcript_3562/g.5213  ORF Transcript_3562/g.5213 Transcript_3562/m.5213 type:complete len:112 (-) Transcript_3562:998-1333(-)